MFGGDLGEFWESVVWCLGEVWESFGRVLCNV